MGKKLSQVNIKNIFLGIILFCSTAVFSKNDSTKLSRKLVLPIIQLNFGYQLPNFDLSKSYGSNYNVGGIFSLIGRKNLMVGIKGSFLWGGELKNRNTIFNNISNTNGNLIDIDGNLNTIITENRGGGFFIFMGKLYKIKNSNKHHICATIGGGLLGHYTNFSFNGKIPQLTGDYQKGYDRLSLGPATNLYLGYLFLHQKNLLNFSFGIDYTFGWVKNMRKYNFDTEAPDLGWKTNGLLRVQVGIIIKLRSEDKAGEGDYYYY